MFTYKIIFVALIASLLSCIEGGVLAPAVHAAPVLPAPISYHHAIPYNVPPYSGRTDIFNKYVSVHAVPAAVPVPVPVPVPHAHALPIPHAHALPIPHAHEVPVAVPHAHAHAHALPVPHAHVHEHAVPAYGHPVAGYAGYPAAAAYPAAYNSYDYGSVAPVPAYGLPAPFLRR